MDKLNFTVVGDDSCCGIVRVGNFLETSTSFFYQSNPPKKWNPAEFEEELMYEVMDRINGDNKYKGSYLLECSMVSDYGGTRQEKQLPILQDYLLLSGWLPITVFQNRNTGNEVTIYHRLLSGEEIEFMEDYDDDNDDLDRSPT